jgi:hypothetical protein
MSSQLTALLWLNGWIQMKKWKMFDSVGNQTGYQQDDVTFAQSQTASWPSSPLRMKIFRVFPFVVEPTMRNLVGWVGWAAQGRKPTKFRTVELYMEKKKRSVFTPVQSRELWPDIEWIMTGHWKARNWKCTTWRRSDTKEHFSRKLPDVRIKKSVTMKKNWFWLACPKQI